MLLTVYLSLSSILQNATDIQMKFGMGIKVTSIEAAAAKQANSSMMMFISEPKPSGE